MSRAGCLWAPLLLIACGPEPEGPAAAGPDLPVSALALASTPIGTALSVNSGPQASGRALSADLFRGGPGSAPPTLLWVEAGGAASYTRIGDTGLHLLLPWLRDPPSGKDAIQQLLVPIAGWPSRGAPVAFQPVASRVVPAAGGLLAAIDAEASPAGWTVGVDWFGQPPWLAAFEGSPTGHDLSATLWYDAPAVARLAGSMMPGSQRTPAAGPALLLRTWLATWKGTLEAREALVGLAILLPEAAPLLGLSTALEGGGQLSLAVDRDGDEVTFGLRAHGVADSSAPPRPWTSLAAVDPNTYAVVAFRGPPRGSARVLDPGTLAAVLGARPVESTVAAIHEDIHRRAAGETQLSLFADGDFPFGLLLVQERTEGLARRQEDEQLLTLAWPRIGPWLATLREPRARRRLDWRDPFGALEALRRDARMTYERDIRSDSALIALHFTAGTRVALKHQPPGLFFALRHAAFASPVTFAVGYGRSLRAIAIGPSAVDRVRSILGRSAAPSGRSRASLSGADNSRRSASPSPTARIMASLAGPRIASLLGGHAAAPRVASRSHAPVPTDGSRTVSITVPGGELAFLCVDPARVGAALWSARSLTDWLIAIGFGPATRPSCIRAGAQGSDLTLRGAWPTRWLPGLPERLRSQVR